MKQIAFLLIGILLSIVSLSQSCLPEGIYFSSQAEIENFQVNYPNCSEIEGEVEISGDDISNLTGLEVLTYIGGDLTIFNNERLNDLNGLNNLTSISGDLWIDANDSLANLNGLENVNTINGSLKIGYNPSLSGLSGINNLTSVLDQILIYNNNTLLDINDLSSLNYIGNSFEIFNCSMLSNLEGLNNLDSIGDRLFISQNDFLADLSGLTNLKYIGASLVIQHNLALTSISDLENLFSIGGNLWIYDNISLVDLDGLQNINAGSIDSLYIIDNPNLSNCDVKSICDYLASPNGAIDIHENDTGCDSQQEVEEACMIGLDEISGPDSYISIYPIPSSTQITIELINKTTPQNNIILSLYNINGKKITQRQISEPKVVIDLMSLNPGVYFVRILSQDNVQVKKILKN